MDGHFFFGPCTALLHQGRKAYILEPIDSEEEKRLCRYKQLVAQGSIINKGNYAMRLASELGHLKTIKFLRSLSGGNICFEANTEEGVMWASRNGHIAVLKFFISQGSSYSLENAILDENFSMIELLISNGAVPNEWTVFYALKAGKFELARRLARLLPKECTFSNLCITTAWRQGTLRNLFLLDAGSNSLSFKEKYLQVLKTLRLYENYKLAKFLTYKGIDLARLGDKYLRISIQNKSYAMSRLFISQGANNKKNYVVPRKEYILSLIMEI